MSETLEVVKIWKTIQGEGPYAGYPAVFVRLAGCNLNCSWCDTDHQTGKQQMSVEQICDEVRRVAGKVHLVVVTGGEPFLQERICGLLSVLTLFYLVQVETNGTIYPIGFGSLPRSVKVVCCPKPGSMVDANWRYRIDAWKYLVQAGPLTERGLPIGVDPPPGGVPVYLQPMDEGDEEVNRRNVEATVQACICGGYRLSLQLHKILGLE